MKVFFRREFVKAYKRCPRCVQEKFKKRLKLFLKDRHHSLLNNHSLRGEWRGPRSIHIAGDWQVLFRYGDKESVEFFIIDTHGNLVRIKTSQHS